MPVDFKLSRLEIESFRGIRNLDLTLPEGISPGQLAPLRHPKRPAPNV